MFSKFFIDRPIFATVLALLIVVADWSHWASCPSHNIRTSHHPPCKSVPVYPGANAQTVAQTVGIPIEQQVNGVDGMLYMSSNSSSSGAYSLTITFAVGTDIDMATVQVQNRVSVAQVVTTYSRCGARRHCTETVIEHRDVPHDDVGQQRLRRTLPQQLCQAESRRPVTRVPGVGAVNVDGSRGLLHAYLARPCRHAHPLSFAGRCIPSYPITEVRSRQRRT